MTGGGPGLPSTFARQDTAFDWPARARRRALRVGPSEGARGRTARHAHCMIAPFLIA
jgi:hypothetical protein